MADLSIASRVADLSVGPARLLSLPTGLRDVVSFRGSFLSAPDLASGDDVVQDLTALLLDKGTKHRDRFAIAETLDGRGARLSFYSDGLRMGFSGRCLRSDLDDVLALAAEQLREPAFDADEVEKARRKAIASVRRATESTGAMASGAYTRRIYPADHPNHIPSPDQEIERLEAITPEAIEAYHSDHVGSDGLLVAFVGDVKPEHTAERLRQALGDWAPHGRAAAYAPEASGVGGGRDHVPLTDKPNLDVRIGHAVSLRRTDDAFLPLFAGVFALGGNFSGRLMQTVRDEQGLTYGIGARLAGVGVEHDMDVRVQVSLSQENLARGLDATREVVDAWASGGVTAEEVARTQTTLVGQHAVALATTGGLAARLLVNAERGFGVDYLDYYSERVRRITPEAVTEAIRDHVDPSRFATVSAGSLAEVSTPSE